MKPSALYFDWPCFLNRVRVDPPPGSPPEVKVWADSVHGSTDGVPVLVFRVWYRTQAGIVGYVGDRITGPQSVFALALADLIRAGTWAATSGVKLCWCGAWQDDWGEVQP